MRTRSVWICMRVPPWVSAVQPGERRPLREHARLVPRELGEALVHPFAGLEPGRELDVHGMVTRLGLEEPRVEPRETRVVHGAREQAEALAAARLDQRAAEQEVHEAARLAAAHALAQPPGVGRRAQRPQAEPARAE